MVMAARDAAKGESRAESATVADAVAQAGAVIGR
jgi:hypothetical protein